jgi:hypothetical protein
VNLNEEYRPKTFDEVVGQDSIIDALRHDVKDPKPAYLFCGGSGQGKTATSRIFAREIGGLIHEIDSGSCSAEDMKSILEATKTRPIGHERIVIIIDECHLLSIQTVSKLLVTIESPPKHLVFILCTTEVDKVPRTIFNRCKVYEFKPIDSGAIQNRLRFICNRGGFKYEEKAIGVVSKMARGSMRQAIAYLEQCSYRDITLSNVKETLMADTYDSYFNLLFNVLDKNIASIVSTIQCIANARIFIEQFFVFILDVNIYVLTQDFDMIDIPEAYKEELDGLTDKDIIVIKKIRDMMVILQYEGRNNPIVDKMFMAELIKISDPLTHT